jgi:hypothetical protein
MSKTHLDSPAAFRLLRRLVARRPFWLLLPLFLGGSAACGPGPDTAVPKRPLPTYGGHEAELFDDGIEPRAVGLELETPDHPFHNPKFKERVEISDAIVRGRVTTVTAREEDTGAAYQVTLKTLEKLTGNHPPGETFTLDIDRRSGAVGVLRNFNGRLVGMSFIVFLRAYVRPDSDQEYHFHITQDAADVKKAVTETAAVIGFAK